MFVFSYLLDALPKQSAKCNRRGRAVWVLFVYFLFSVPVSCVLFVGWLVVVFGLLVWVGGGGGLLLLCWGSCCFCLFGVVVYLFLLFLFCCLVGWVWGGGGGGCCCFVGDVVFVCLGLGFFVFLFFFFFFFGWLVCFALLCFALLFSWLIDVEVPK